MPFARVSNGSKENMSKKQSRAGPNVGFLSSVPASVADNGPQ